MARRIGELLVDAGAVSEVDLRQALLQQKKQGGKPRLGELLLSLKKVTPADLARALADQFKLAYTEIPADIPPAISRGLTQEFQKKHQVLPFRKDVVSGVDQIHVAVVDPTQKELLEQIRGKFREVLRFYVAAPADVSAGIERAAKAPTAMAPPPVAAPSAAVPPAASADPLDELLGGGAPVSAAADPLGDLLGGGPSLAASGDPLDELLGGLPSAAPTAPTAPSVGDPLDELLGDSPSAAPAAPSAGDPLDDLLGRAAPASTAAGDPLDDLLGGAPAEPAVPRTPPAYVHMYPPRPRPPPPAPEPAAPVDGALENEFTPPSGTAFDELPPEMAASAGPSLSDEDAWLLQELNRLASGDPAQADALSTVASVVRMLVRKGIIEQEALLGELGR